MRYYKIGMQEVRKRNDIVAFIKNGEGIIRTLFRSAELFNGELDDIYFEYDKNYGVFPTDYLANNFDWFLVSEKLKEVIEKSECDAQFFKIKVKEKHGDGEYDYYVANILTAVPALDLERSAHFDTEYNGEVIHHIIKYALNENKINGKDIFMLSDDITAEVLFCSERFKRLYRDEKLTGIKFRDIKVN